MIPKFTISIVAFNNLALTRKCIETVFAHSGHDFELLLTDNASTDGTQEFFVELAATFANVRVVINSENQGFIQPQNAAFRLAVGEYFVTLNNDVEVGPEWLVKMEAAFRADPKLALCGIMGTCSVLDEHGHGHPGDRTDYVEGSCMMVRTALQREHGFFDDDLRFIYCDDSELSLRMRSLGYTLARVKAPVRHLGAATSNKVKGEVDVEGYALRNRNIMMRKWPRFFAAKKLEETPKKKLLLRRGEGIGDVILVTPVIRELRQRFPHAFIGMVTNCPQGLENNPDLNWIGTGASEAGWDLYFNLDLAYEAYPMRHIVASYAERCWLTLADWTPRVFPSVASRRAIDTLELPTGKVAVVHPGRIGGWAGRQWPEDRMSRVTEALQKRGMFVVLIGNDRTPDLAKNLDFRGRPFNQTVALLERASLFVGVDSSPLHVAQGFNVPAVGIFGAIEPKYRLIPGGRAVGVVAKNVGCLGCHHYLPAPRIVTKECLRQGQMHVPAKFREPCMEKLRVEDVLAGVEEVTA